MTGPQADDGGEATVVVPQSFSGFFSFTGASAIEPTLLYPGNLLAGESTFAPPVTALKPSELPLVAQALNTTVDPNAGIAFVTAYDCFDRCAPGVAFSANGLGATSVQWYTGNVGGLPSTTMQETATEGAGGILNLPPGEITVTAALTATKRLFATATVAVKPGGVTLIWFRARTH